MKSFIVISMVLLFTLAFTQSCQAQPKADYEIYSDSVQGATKYHFFIEKHSADPYHLEQGMDYLAPDVTAYKVGESDVPMFDVNLDNDGSEYKVGVVAENVSGFYSGMGTGVGNVGEVPSVPNNVGIRKK